MLLPEYTVRSFRRPAYMYKDEHVMIHLCEQNVIFNSYWEFNKLTTIRVKSSFAICLFLFACFLWGEIMLKWALWV